MSSVAYEVGCIPDIQASGLRELEKAFADCEVRLGHPATNLDVCTELGLSLKALYSMLDQHKGIGPGRVEDCSPAEEESGAAARIRYFPDPANEAGYRTYSKSGFSLAMAAALEALPRNEKLVVSLHHNEELTMQEIAEIFGVSPARVGQIHTTAMLRIRGKLQSSGQA
ncbi:MAG: polymerase, sigma 28 subunit, FliA/WhiG subfamily [Acidobacteria bacterium]|jgi:RNA polymerase sigma factor (sigma-70 family)|nr:polymerase, sigma 28 subunit, FliA/WhiG subfamily [Acidobacteriota bacterium]